MSEGPCPGYIICLLLFIKGWEEGNNGVLSGAYDF